MKINRLYLPLVASLLAIAVGLSNPAWAVKDKKIAPGDKAETEIGIKDNKSDVKGGPGKDKDKDKGGSAGNTLKKNAVKGAGAAAATGVATKKAKSAVKGN